MSDLDKPSFFENLKEKITESAIYKSTRSFVGFVHAQVWPVYSLGMIVAAVSLVGAVHEKQCLTDYLYGSQTSEDVSEAVRTSQNTIDDETSHLIKAEVFQWSRNKFRAEALLADV